MLLIIFLASRLSPWNGLYVLAKVSKKSLFLTHQVPYFPLICQKICESPAAVFYSLCPFQIIEYDSRD